MIRRRRGHMSKKQAPHPLQKWLQDNGMSMAEASRRLHRSHACISRYIRGIRIPDAVDRQAIAELTADAVPVSFWHSAELEARARRAA